MIKTEAKLGMTLEYLVMKPSRKPAEKVNGKVLIKILTPVFTPLLNETFLE